jgi:hypothetical protein
VRPAVVVSVTLPSQPSAAAGAPGAEEV